MRVRNASQWQQKPSAPSGELESLPSVSNKSLDLLRGRSPLVEMVESVVVMDMSVSPRHDLIFLPLFVCLMNFPAECSWAGVYFVVVEYSVFIYFIAFLLSVNRCLALGEECMCTYALAELWITRHLSWLCFIATMLKENKFRFELLQEKNSPLQCIGGFIYELVYRNELLNVVTIVFKTLRSLKN